MQNKYLMVVLALVCAAMLVFSAVTVHLFSQGLRRQRGMSEKRMESVAAYCAAHIDDALSAAGPAMPPSDELDAWLASFASASGFARIVAGDSLGVVQWSSNSLILRGDDIRPYLVDTALYQQAFETRKPRFSRPVRIDNTFFKSLYYPFAGPGAGYVIVVETDENYFALAQQFRTNVLFSAAVLLVILACLAGAFVAVGGRAQAALRRAQRNEELAFLGRASAELAHELKNPLAVIKSSADVLQRRFDPDKKERVFGFLSDEIMRLSRLVNDILSFSREKRLLREPFCAREVLLAQGDAVAMAFQGVTVECQVPELLRLVGDRDAFAQIASNLMRNAAAAMEGKGNIVVKAEWGRELRLLFCDNGPGIAGPLAADLFKPFVSGSKTGTGLGLAIARTLCEASGWKISLDAHVLGNTVFRITIPGDLWAKS